MFCFLSVKKSVSVKQADCRNVLKWSSKSVCSTNFLVSPNHLSPTPSTSSAMKTPENAEENSGDSEPADVEDIQMEYFSE
jgi:hypothetical protein